MLDMYLDDPSGARVLSDLRDNGYEGAVIATSGSSESHQCRTFASAAQSRSAACSIGAHFDLGELETAVEGVSRPL